MDRITDFMARRPRWSALLLGLVSATGFQPLHIWPFALAAMGALVWLVHRQESARRAFFVGWVFGVAHFTLTNNWIATAFTYQAELPAALGWAAVPLLSLYLAVYPGLAALAGWLIARRHKLPVFALAFGAAWVAAEWLRSWVFTGYAWGPFSMAFLGDWERAGLAGLLPATGTYALSGIAVAISGLLAWSLASRRWIALAAIIVVFSAGMFWPAPAEEEGFLPVTLVQPNLRQEELDDPSKFEEQFQRIAALSRPGNPVSRRLVLWPESGVPDYLREGYPRRYYVQMTAGGDPAFARYRIGQTIGEGSLLLTGAVDLEIGEVDGRERATGAYNAITPIDAQGNLGQRYAKAHLVPYGEYLPLRSWLEPLGLRRLVAGSIDFIPGPGPQTFDFGNWGKAGMQICYEIVFSGEVAEPGNRPDYIFNPSNDGWFGAWGPPQHLAQARMRAVEEGLPVLRATTTGISAIIDARGIVRHAIGRGEAAKIDTLVPPPAEPTLFARFGHWLTLFWGIVLLAVSLVASRLSARYQPDHT
ncbi:apolipoprotein N-acyltransferase [Qipengyuania xiapuensis]|uniref:Apolipoprotein N-acyltransferase n=1 Tax=Qipengyuania xiapuensis TaxID=2867236 RepID=A0ABX8ZRZ0_9SPHN|nr:apolipoprotein N-acyltransferase [Qipengyuania xiapuensis]QZD91793.1 apolipoprotein N-acyltransferase [Qipengyuania xiapuensis]